MKALSYPAKIACILTFIPALSLGEADSAKIEAPAWVLTGLDGKPSKLADYRGKVVVLNFWGTFCSPCLKEVPEFVATQQKYQDKDVVVVGAAMDKNNNAVVKTFAKKYFINYPIIIATSAMLQAYGVVVAPATYLIDKQGRIAFRHVGALTRQQLEQHLKPLL